MGTINKNINKMSKPLTTEDAAPCMYCGSVQCAFCSEKVISAVEWLKESVNDLYKGKSEAWRMVNDELCDQCEEFFKKKINEAFPVLNKKINQDKIKNDDSKPTDDEPIDEVYYEPREEETSEVFTNLAVSVPKKPSSGNQDKKVR